MLTPALSAKVLSLRPPLNQRYRCLRDGLRQTGMTFNIIRYHGALSKRSTESLKWPPISAYDAFASAMPSSLDGAPALN